MTRKLEKLSHRKIERIRVRCEPEGNTFRIDMLSRFASLIDESPTGYIVEVWEEWPGDGVLGLGGCNLIDSKVFDTPHAQECLEWAQKTILSQMFENWGDPEGTDS